MRFGHQFIGISLRQARQVADHVGVDSEAAVGVLAETDLCATGVTAQVGFGKDTDGGYGINAHMIGYLPGLAQREADELMAKAHQVCPYSKATRGNIDVTVSAKV